LGFLGLPALIALALWGPSTFIEMGDSRVIVRRGWISKRVIVSVPVTATARFQSERSGVFP
jgi:hypothetical protein